MDSNMTNTNLLVKPVIPTEWESRIKQMRHQRYLQRRQNQCFGVGWDRPEDPLGYWPIFVRVVKSVKDSTEFDKKTRRPRKIFVYAYVFLLVDIGQSVRKVCNEVRDKASSVLRNRDISLEWIDGKVMNPDRTMEDYLSYMEDGLVLHSVMV